ncbi:hypothetical protein TcasGA2_TC003723 [Tribolium castaneum]|uniref:Uncharacterized protein n=1 Tax=Tribolium castaneum TaxID=7070 RepID=D6WDV6_TRICA|nr:hypothetical protein TcasGA2_TC003723 [Tribolium castaneum]
MASIRKSKVNYCKRMNTSGGPVGTSTWRSEVGGFDINQIKTMGCVGFHAASAINTTICMCDAAYYRYGNEVLLIVNFIEASASCSAHLARPSTNHEPTAKKTRVIEELQVQCILMDLLGLSTSAQALLWRFYSSLEHSAQRSVMIRNFQPN